MHELGNLQCRRSHAGDDQFAAGEVEEDRRGGGAGLHLVTRGIGVRCGETGEEIDRRVPEHPRGARDQRTTEVQLDFDFLGDQLEHVLGRVAIRETGRIGHDFRRGERRKHVAQDRFEQAQSHVEVVDEEPERLLIGDWHVEIESAIGWEADKRRGVADPDRGDIDLDVLEGGESVSDVDVRDALQLSEYGSQLGLDLEDQFIQLRLDAGDLRIEHLVNLGSDLRPGSLQPGLDCPGNGARDPVNGAGHRFLNRVPEMLGDDLLDRLEQRVDHGLDRFVDRVGDRRYQGIEYPIHAQARRRGFELAGHVRGDRVDRIRQGRLQFRNDGVDDRIHLRIDRRLHRRDGVGQFGLNGALQVGQFRGQIAQGAIDRGYGQQRPDGVRDARLDRDDLAATEVQRHAAFQIEEFRNIDQHLVRGGADPPLISTYVEGVCAGLDLEPDGIELVIRIGIGGEDPLEIGLGLRGCNRILEGIGESVDHFVNREYSWRRQATGFKEIDQLMQEIDQLMHGRQVRGDAMTATDGRVQLGNRDDAVDTGEDLEQGLPFARKTACEIHDRCQFGDAAPRGQVQLHCDPGGFEFEHVGPDELQLIRRRFQTDVLDGITRRGRLEQREGRVDIGDGQPDRVLVQFRRPVDTEEHGQAFGADIERLDHLGRAGAHSNEMGRAFLEGQAAADEHVRVDSQLGIGDAGPQQVAVEVHLQRAGSGIEVVTGTVGRIGEACLEVHHDLVVGVRRVVGHLDTRGREI